MHPLLMKRFQEDFPSIAGLTADAGFRCYSGWGLLLYGFFLDATEHCAKHGGQIRIQQIKEKFGRLRIYCSYKGGTETEAGTEFVPEAFGALIAVRPYPSSPTLSKIIDFYEMASAHYCEICGRPGHIDDSVTSRLKWVSTLCFDHANLLIESRDSDDEIDFSLLEESIAGQIDKDIDQLKARKSNSNR